MKLYWTMKNGQQIDIDQMTETHLRNTLKMIVRNSQTKTPVIKKRIGNIEANFMEELHKEYEEEHNQHYF
jgi:hypothetical protein